MFNYFGHVTHANFEFTPLTDDHFDVATLPYSLEDLNLNGCREISEKTIMLLAKSCPNLKRIGITISLLNM